MLPDVTSNVGEFYKQSRRVLPEKLTGFVRSRTEGVLALNNQYGMRPLFDEAAKYYRRDAKSGKKKE